MKNNQQFETEYREFKREIPEKLENSVIAFLNTGGGEIHIGINDDGTIYNLQNIDESIRIFASRVKENISPSVVGLFTIAVKESGGKKFFIVTVASGIEKPYFLNKYGRTPKGCFIRIGTQNSPMPQEMIDTLYSKRNPNTLINLISPRQNLTFRALKIYYDEMGYTINENFLRNLDFYLPDGKFNYLAYLMADENGTSIKVAKFLGDDPSPVEKDEFGRGCLIKAAYSVLEKLKIYNQTAVEFDYPKRKETKLIDAAALREAALNAIIHNDYINCSYPIYSIYDDRIEILSTGGLPGDLTIDEFFNGRSHPRYRELIRIFTDLDLGEQLGSGMKKIMMAYEPKDYEISKNFVIAKFKYNKHARKIINNEKGGEKGGEKVTDNQLAILELIRKNQNITIPELSNLIRIHRRKIEQNISKLKEKGIIERVGPDKGGHWKIVKNDISI